MQGNQSMRCCCLGSRCALVLFACALWGGLATSWLPCPCDHGNALAVRAEETAPGADCPMFGGTPQRNMANPLAKKLPLEWSVKEGERKNVKWVAELGSVSYGGPIIAGGKVFVGTNNERP